MLKFLRSHEHDVYQFRITLRDFFPPIWRRIQVPRTYNFWDLHMAIQSVMGWSDSHFHQFTLMTPTSKRIRSKVIIIPKLKNQDDIELNKENILSSKEAVLSEFFLCPKMSPKVVYEYDFLSGWELEVRFEKFVAAESGKKYPCCKSGGLASPPEQISGPEAYKEFVKYYTKYVKEINQEKEEKCKCIQECMHSIAPRLSVVGFDPDVFNPESVDFYDPESFWEYFVKKIVTVQKNWMFASY
ncbi:hypothetical protein R5R35_000779 [Gryllus longicercus]|uniref:Plasmid pRiA4b Orf3-like domain-containing protein n=1 Tax=Gryllus longicercus TaxID=2509291 RepID=A0AAN9YYV1_9ORTH